MTASSTLRSGLALAAFALLAPGSAGALSATHGSNVLYLSTGPEDNGGGDTGTDRTGDDDNESDEARFLFSISGSSLSIDYNVLTSEITEFVADPFVIQLLDNVAGNVIGAIGAIGLANGSFPAVTGFSGPPLLGPDGSVFVDGELGWQTATIALPAGVKTIEIWVADEEDDIVDTALLIDNIRTEAGLWESFESLPTGVGPGLPQSGFIGNVTVESAASFVPEPSAAALLALGAFALRRRRRS